MRGSEETSGSLFSYVDLDAPIPARHPLRKIRRVGNAALASLDEVFAALNADFGRPSIAPERQLMEQMEYNLLFRWFVRLEIVDPASVPTVFSKNRDRRLNTEMSREVMGQSWRSVRSRRCSRTSIFQSMAPW